MGGVAGHKVAVQAQFCLLEHSFYVLALPVDLRAHIDGMIEWTRTVVEWDECMQGMSGCMGSLAGLDEWTRCVNAWMSSVDGLNEKVDGWMGWMR